MNRHSYPTSKSTIAELDDSALILSVIPFSDDCVILVNPRFAIFPACLNSKSPQIFFRDFMMSLRTIVGLCVLAGLFMLAVSLYVGGGLPLICDRQRSVDCKLQTRRWLNQVVMEEQQIFELQRVSVGTRVLDLVTKGGTLRI